MLVSIYALPPICNVIYFKIKLLFKLIIFNLDKDRLIFKKFFNMGRKKNKAN